jgi:hypothetical protein
MVMARSVRYARRVLRILIAVPRTPKAIVITVSEDTGKHVSKGLGMLRVVEGGRWAFSSWRLECLCARLSTK